MLEQGYLVLSEHGARVGLEFEGATVPFDTKLFMECSKEKPL